MCCDDPHLHSVALLTHPVDNYTSVLDVWERVEASAVLAQFPHGICDIWLNSLRNVSLNHFLVVYLVQHWLVFNSDFGSMIIGQYQHVLVSFFVRFKFLSSKNLIIVSDSYFGLLWVGIIVSDNSRFDLSEGTGSVGSGKVMDLRHLFGLMLERLYLTWECVHI